MTGSDVEACVGIEEVAKYLKVKKRTAYYLVQTLQIPHYRLGRMIRFKLSEIADWMKTKKCDVFDIDDLSNAA